MARKSSSTTYKEYLSTFGAVSRHSIKHLYEYPVHRILEGTIEAVTPPADSPVQVSYSLYSKHSCSQFSSYYIDVHEINLLILCSNIVRSKENWLEAIPHHSL
ncbi:hypothetical protein LINPERHAP1_LOCUS1318 [Linum perenne]